MDGKENVSFLISENDRLRGNIEMLLETHEYFRKENKKLRNCIKKMKEEIDYLDIIAEESLFKAIQDVQEFLVEEKIKE
jgi:cell division septum initiation protein DivIVA